MKILTSRRFAGILLLLFLLLLSKFILFKNFNGNYRQFFPTSVKKNQIREGFRKANFVPFTTIQLFSKSRRLRTEYKIDNLAGNTLGFLPVGFLLCIIISKRHRFLWVLLAVFGISLLFEMIQMSTGWGVFDVDDLILNTFGGVLGIIIYTAFQSLNREAQKKATG